MHWISADTRPAKAAPGGPFGGEGLTFSRAYCDNSGERPQGAKGEPDAFACLGKSRGVGQSETTGTKRFWPSPQTSRTRKGSLR